MYISALPNANTEFMFSRIHIQNGMKNTKTKALDFYFSLELNFLDEDLSKLANQMIMSTCVSGHLIKAYEGSLETFWITVFSEIQN